MPKRPSRAVVVIAVLLGLLLLGYRLLDPAEPFSSTDRIEIATGQPNGIYDRFVRSMASELPLPISSRTTVGSLDNIELLRTRQTDYAIVQSDIAQYYYFGERRRPRFSDLALVMPLFPEFIQILVPAESDISVLSDLRGTTVCLGERGSGTHFNSIDVFSQASLNESIDFIPVNLPTATCIERLVGGADVHAVFVTSNLDYAASDPRLRQLFLSDTALQSIVSRYPYYRIDQRPGAGESARPQLVVDALLVTHSAESAGTVYAITRQLVDHWRQLGRGVHGLIRPGERAHAHRLAYHDAAQSALISMGIQRRNYLLYGLAAAWALVLILCLVSERVKNSYNRLGDSTVSAWGHTLLVRYVGKVSQIFIALTTLVLFFVVAVYFLVMTEDFYAEQIGAVSPFSAMGFVDSILWLFTYIASGFTADGIYPVSVPGKAIVAVLAVVGLVAPITGVVFVVNMMSRRNQRHLQGLGTTALKNHVVICGWNEKVPGLIYTLTGKDVDRQMRVVLVADFDEKYPLDRYGFNPRYVTLCRGDTADPAVLGRASIEQAAVVLVLADFKASKTHNRKSVLTAMTARRANPGAYICAELEYVDNIDFYEASGCDSLVYPGLVISRLATATVLSPLILDYVMDVITYHEFDELRSVAVAELGGLTAAIGLPISTIEQSLVTQGVNLVGVMHGASRERLRECVFGAREQRGTLLDAKHRSLPLQAGDILIYSSERENLRLDPEAAGSLDPIEGECFGIRYPERLRVLICGDAEAIDVIERGLAHVIADLTLTKIDVEQESLHYLDDIDAAAPEEYDRVVILAAQSRRSELTGFDDLNEIDAEQILTTRLFREAFRRRGSSPTIIAEVSNIRNKPLLVDSGANVVLPALLAAERFLAKQAYDRNNVTDFLMAAMNLEDGIHLHNHTVKPGDGFCGRPYAQILSTPIDGAKVLGWLPWAERKALTNDQGDFDYHFRTVIDQRMRHLVASERDEIIMMVEKRDVYGSAPRIMPAPPEPGGRRTQQPAPA